MDLNGFFYSAFLQTQTENEDDDDGEYMVVFARPSASRALSASPPWFMDGTYKVKPELAAQLYCVHYVVHDDVLPAVYVLMKKKAQQSYEILFKAIKNALPANRQQGPTRVSLDFEQAAIAALREVFPQTIPSCCY